MTIYAQRVVEALREADMTMAELVQRTGFTQRYVRRGIGDARAAGTRITAVQRKDDLSLYRLRGPAA